MKELAAIRPALPIEVKHIKTKQQSKDSYHHDMGINIPSEEESVSSQSLYRGEGMEANTVKADNATRIHGMENRIPNSECNVSLCGGPREDPSFAIESTGTCHVLVLCNEVSREEYV